jgi:hypothetical protein
VDESDQHDRADHRHREVSDAPCGLAPIKPKIQRPITAPTSPMMMSAMTPKPEPRITRPAIHPAISPRMMVPSICGLLFGNQQPGA